MSQFLYITIMESECPLSILDCRNQGASGSTPSTAARERAAARVSVTPSVRDTSVRDTSVRDTSVRDTSCLCRGTPIRERLPVCLQELLWLVLHVLALVVYGGATLALLAMVLPAPMPCPTRPRAAPSWLGLLVYDRWPSPRWVCSSCRAPSILPHTRTAYGRILRSYRLLLVWKLILAFLVVLIGTYITFGSDIASCEPKWRASPSIRPGSAA